MARSPREVDSQDASQSVPDPTALLWSEEPPPRRGGQLSRSEIVYAALEVADREGADAISMRRIADELGVGTMSIYYYVSGKDQLLDLMQDEVLREFHIPPGELSDDWREALTQILRRTRDAFREHPWCLKNIRPQFGPHAFRHIEQSLSIFAGLDLPLAKISEMIAVADEFVMGFVIAEHAWSEAVRRSGLPRDDYEKAIQQRIEALAEGGEVPHLAALSAEDMEQLPHDKRFETGLGWLLAGMETEIAEHVKVERPARR